MTGTLKGVLQSWCSQYFRYVHSASCAVMQAKLCLVPQRESTLCMRGYSSCSRSVSRRRDWPLLLLWGPGCGKCCLKATFSLNSAGTVTVALVCRLCVSVLRAFLVITKKPWGCRQLYRAIECMHNCSLTDKLLCDVHAELAWASHIHLCTQIIRC